MTEPPTRRELIEPFLAHSPFVAHLGLRLSTLKPDRAILEMPFRPELATFGEVVHGGAIAALLDTAAMTAAWSDDTVPTSPAGATVSLAVDYVAPAKGQDLTATATVTRRGQRLCFVRVEVTDPEDRVVASALVTHAFA